MIIWVCDLTLSRQQSTLLETVLTQFSDTYSSTVVYPGLSVLTICSLDRLFRYTLGIMIITYLNIYSCPCKHLWNNLNCIICCTIVFEIILCLLLKSLWQMCCMMLIYVLNLTIWYALWFGIHKAVHPKHYPHNLCYFVFCCVYASTNQFYPCSSGLLLLQWGQSYDCLSGTYVTLMNMGKYTTQIHKRVMI